MVNPCQRLERRGLDSIGLAELKQTSKQILNLCVAEVGECQRLDCINSINRRCIVRCRGLGSIANEFRQKLIELP